MKAVLMVFSPASLDKSFIQQQITHRSFEPFIRAIPQISLVIASLDAEILQITPSISMLPMPVACRSHKSDNDVGSAITLLFAGV
ncbi:Putative anti-FlhC(2)FlhD(4) factor YdiV [Escherichia coli]|nr:Putative anti-FlhC(2)FlhD(4) factor YdiV [Escherichia coli]